MWSTWKRKSVSTLSASLAYYMMLALFPGLIVIKAVIDGIGGGGEWEFVLEALPELSLKSDAERAESYLIPSRLLLNGEDIFDSALSLWERLSPELITVELSVGKNENEEKEKENKELKVFEKQDIIDFINNVPNDFLKEYKNLIKNVLN